MSTSDADVQALAFDELGPVEYLIVEFGSGQVTGAAFHELLDLVAGDHVRVLDLEFVGRDAAGAVTLLDPDAIVTAAGDELAQFAGASSGLLDTDDAMVVGDLIKPGSIAAILIYESVWVAALAAQLPRDQARVISMGQIPARELTGVVDGAPA
ncbi:DUF6325 family protein [Paractinoplanes maris]|uniref:DUF6325 family protein n=1 Tax=Paractinoplanes maris TaxID=1734446 RepID=UPI00201FD723|nr:DUF6325 family protein [Actinoplanes maris]